MFCLLIKISPLSAGSKRLMQRKNVLFPPPLGPMIAITSPFEIVVLIFFKTSNSPYFFVNF